METKGDYYLVPTGDGKSKIPISLVEIAKAEQRLQDVAIVNKFNAPELLACFNDNWLKLNKSVTMLTYQKNIAENTHRRAKAEAKLNCTDEVIKARGHSKASADLREAMVEIDETVRTTKDTLDEISAVLAIIHGKQQAFYNAYNSVKKLVSDNQLPAQHYGNGNKPEPYQAPVAPVAPKAVKLNIVDEEFEPLPAGFGVSYK